MIGTFKSSRFLTMFLLKYFLGSCGSRVTVPSKGGTSVTSPNWPNAYLNNANCQWTITSPQGTQLQVLVYDISNAL